MDYDIVRNHEKDFDYYIVPANRLLPAIEYPAYVMEETETLKELSPLFDALWEEYLTINDFSIKKPVASFWNATGFLSIILDLT